MARNAVTVAERGSRESSAISPKKSPSPRRTVPAGRFDLHCAAGDQVHGIAALALADDGGAGGHRARLQHAHEVGDGGGVEAGKQWHARHHGEGDDEVAAPDLLVKAAADDGDGQREAADAQHDRDGGDDAPERREGRDLVAADLGQHRGGPPHGLGHVAETVGLDRAFHGMHGGGGGEQDAGEDDDAGEQRAPFAGDQAAERGQRRRVAGELQEAHQPRQRHQCARREEQLQQQRQQRQRVDDHQRRCRKAQPRAAAARIV